MREKKSLHTLFDYKGKNYDHYPSNNHISIFCERFLFYLEIFSKLRF